LKKENKLTKKKKQQIRRLDTDSSKLGKKLAKEDPGIRLI